MKQKPRKGAHTGKNKRIEFSKIPKKYRHLFDEAAPKHGIATVKIILDKTGITELHWKH